MSTTIPFLSTQEDRERVRHIVAQASEPIAPFWPMRTMIAQNPLHGLEYLPFDQAVRKGKHLLGGNGYLSNDEYRQFFREGRITPESFERAFGRMGPQHHETIKAGDRHITTQEVWTLHLKFGFEPLPVSLLDWELHGGGRALKRLRQDLPEESRARIIEQTIRECEQCREHPEEAYLGNLWNSSMVALRLSETFHNNQPLCRRSPAHGNFDHEAAPIDLPLQRTLSDWIDTFANAGLVESINNQLIKWVSAFLDEGLCVWEMPGRECGFYQAWRTLVQKDFSCRFLGIRDFEETVRNLPETPEDAILQSLQRLGISSELWKDYLSRELSVLPGWTRYIRWLGEHPDYHAQKAHPIDLLQYLAVRMFYEVELAHVVCQREWGLNGTLAALKEFWNEHQEEYKRCQSNGLSLEDPIKQATCRDAWRLFHLAQFLELRPLDLHDLSPSDAQTLVQWLDDYPSDQHGSVWLEAYEDSFRQVLLKKVVEHRHAIRTETDRPRAQLVFCIDVRSESFRRHIEAVGPYETFGFAGFFGIPISYQPFDKEERSALCPVLLCPNHAVTEAPRLGTEPQLQEYSSGSRWYNFGHHLFHDLKHNPIGSLMTIDVLGLMFSAALVGKTLLQQAFRTMTQAVYKGLARIVPTQILVAAPSDPQHPQLGEVPPEGIPPGLAQGFSLQERAAFIENGLRAMGLTQNFARVVCLCGHGSQTDNNPYFGALDCGACGGNPGDANARVFAAMANDPAVREILNEHGLSIPDDTWFLPAKHNTTTDRVLFYDLQELPDTHREDFQILKEDLERAGANQALERCQRLPHAPTDISSQEAFRHVEVRSCDWANPRPEWGLSGNGAFLIGRRLLTRGLDLGGRVFLHSYDPTADPQGAILEKIMTAPLVVGEWINTGYYFSAVDPWGYGSGSKVLHNVVGGVGVMLGSQSDLQMGFPLQTVNDGPLHYHEPMRLLAIIEHSPTVISSIIHKYGILQQLFHNQWLNLVALDPQTFSLHRYNPDTTWEPVALSLSSHSALSDSVPSPASK